MKWVNRLYIFFVGIILTVTTGFGIAAFYPEPVRPQYPYSDKPVMPIPQSCYATPEANQTPECQIYYQEQAELNRNEEAKRQAYETELRAFENKNAGYTRTAIFFGITIGSLYAVLAIAMIKRSKLAATGLMLAGVLTAIFARLLISLASLGASVSGTESANMIGYMQFFILLILSIVVVAVGLFNLKDDTSSK
jgi:hypothetical protein